MPKNLIILPPKQGDVPSTVKHLVEESNTSLPLCFNLSYSGIKQEHNFALTLGEALLSKDNLTIQDLTTDGNNIGGGFQNQQEGHGVRKLAQAVKKTQTKALYLRDNQLNDKDIECLAEECVTENSSLETLNLTNNGITSKGIEPLVAALIKDNSSLIHLDLEGNMLGDEGVEFLANLLEDPNCKIKTLVLAANDITPKGAKRLATALIKNTNLQTLNMLDNPIGSAFSDLETRVSERSFELIYNKPVIYNKPDNIEQKNSRNTNPNTHLLNLNAVQNSHFALCRHVTPQDVEGIVQGVSANTELTALDIAHNRIHMNGEFASTFAAALNQHKNSLIKLEAGDNEIGGGSDNPNAGLGVEDLMQALQNQTKLKKLHLNNNQLNDRDITLVADYCVTGKLTEINIANNCITSESVDSLSKMLASLDLRYLDLSSNNIGDEGAIKLAKELGSSRCTKKLILNNCGITITGAMAIAEAVIQSNYLIDISLGIPTLDTLLERYTTSWKLQHALEATKKETKKTISTNAFTDILKNYQSNSFLGWLLGEWWVSKTIQQLRELQKNSVVTMDDVRQKLGLGERIEHRLNFFNNSEVKSDGSGTDNVLCKLREAFLSPPP
ncbi:MAG: hypothetical protein Q8R83_04675 [Legionellaceae bacterium]|nr:hypothetical protein [Legionellaceae bacterium]